MRRAMKGLVAVALVAVALVAVALPAAAETISGPAAVIDGTTLEIGGQRVRLCGVSALAPDTPEGFTARVLLMAMIEVSQEPVRCLQRTPPDHQGVATAACSRMSGGDIASDLILAGAAFTPPENPSIYAVEQEQAQRAGRGLWRTPATAIRIAAREAPLRSAPRDDAAVLAQVPSGQSVSIIAVPFSVPDGWHRVQVHDTPGYLRTGQLAPAR